MWRFATWNLNWWRRDPEMADSQRFLAGFDADVVALQEVRGRSWQQAHDGPSVFAHTLHGPATWGWMGCALLLRPDADVFDAGVVTSLPKPQRSVWARVRLPSGVELTAVSWHAPNRAGDGLATKMAGYRAMSEWLASAPRPLVLGADLNTWTDPVDIETPVPGAEHFDEHAFVGPSPGHGLRDAYRDVIEQRGELAQRRASSRPGPLAVSYVLRNGVPHRMDRIFISGELRAIDGGYDHAGAVRAGSDHALHWIDLADHR